MDRKLAIKTINRLDEIGALDMKCVRDVIGTDKERTMDALEFLMALDLYDIKNQQIRKWILMDDEEFNRKKWMAKLFIKNFDFQQTGSIKSLFSF